MSGHDIDSISEDGLSPLTHETHEDYNFIALKHNLLIQVTFNISLDPPMPPLLDLDTLIKDIRGEELAPNITIRADVNFVDLRSFVEGPKFWKTVPHLFDFLCCMYFDVIDQVSFSFYHLFNIFCLVNCHGRTFHIWTLL